MHLAALIAVLLAALALSCPPPFNNRAFLANETHTSAQLIEAALAAHGNLGWTEAVSDELNNKNLKRWPKDGEENDGTYTHTVTYCYRNEEAQSKIQPYMTEAIALWAQKIGSAGKANGHALQIKTKSEKGSYPYCYLENRDWNDFFPDGSLVLELWDSDNGETAQASLGYMPDGSVDRHYIIFNAQKLKENPYPAATVAHELG